MAHTPTLIEPRNSTRLRAPPPPHRRLRARQTVVGLQTAVIDANQEAESEDDAAAAAAAAAAELSESSSDADGERSRGASASGASAGRRSGASLRDLDVLEVSALDEASIQRWQNAHLLCRFAKRFCCARSCMFIDGIATHEQAIETRDADLSRRHHRMVCVANSAFWCCATRCILSVVVVVICSSAYYFRHPPFPPLTAAVFV